MRFIKKPKSILFVVVFIYLSSLLLTLSAGQWQDIAELLMTISISDLSSEAQNFSLTVEDNTDYASVSVKEIIANSDFKQGLQDWGFKGHVKAKQDGTNFYVQLGHEQSSNLLQENCISQEIFTTAADIFLGVSYQLSSVENLVGFDTVPWVILLNDQLVYAAANIANTAFNTTADWQWKVLRLQPQEQGKHLLSLCAGNIGDRYQPSWIKVNQLTTHVAAVNADQFLNIQAADEQLISVSYETSNQKIAFEPAVQQQLHLDQPLEQNQLKLEFFENDQLVSEKNVPVFYSSGLALAGGSIADFYVFRMPVEAEEDQQKIASYLLVFPNIFSSHVEHQYQLQHYFDIRYYQVNFTDENWSLLDPVQTLSRDLPLNLIQPDCYGDFCFLNIDAPYSAEPLFFALKVCDVSRNCSAMSKVIKEQSFNLSLLKTFELSLIE